MLVAVQALTFESGDDMTVRASFREHLAIWRRGKHHHGRYLQFHGKILIDQIFPLGLRARCQYRKIECKSKRCLR